MGGGPSRCEIRCADARRALADLGSPDPTPRADQVTGHRLRELQGAFHVLQPHGIDEPELDLAFKRKWLANHPDSGPAHQRQQRQQRLGRVNRAYATLLTADPAEKRGAIPQRLANPYGR